MIEELKTRKMEYEMVEEFLISLKKEFGSGEGESVKVAELRKLNKKRGLWKSLCRNLSEQ